MQRMVDTHDDGFWIQRTALKFVSMIRTHHCDLFHVGKTWERHTKPHDATLEVLAKDLRKWEAGWVQVVLHLIAFLAVELTSCRVVWEFGLWACIIRKTLSVCSILAIRTNYSSGSSFLFTFHAFRYLWWFVAMLLCIQSTTWTRFNVYSSISNMLVEKKKLCWFILSFEFHVQNHSGDKLKH